MSESGERTDLPPAAYALLALIRDGVTSGYQMKRRMERALFFFWSVSYGQIYPHLRRLEAAGLISAHETTEGGRLRREFTLTPAGEQELQRWLEEPAEPSIWLQDEGILRLRLVDWDDRELARKNLAALRRATAKRLDTLNALTPPRERGRSLQDLGRRILQTTLDWCDENDAELRRGG